MIIITVQIVETEKGININPQVGCPKDRPATPGESLAAAVITSHQAEALSRLGMTEQPAVPQGNG